MVATLISMDTSANSVLMADGMLSFEAKNAAGRLSHIGNGASGYSALQQTEISAQRMVADIIPVHL